MRGRDWAHPINAGELEASPFFFLNLKGNLHNSQDHETIINVLMTFEMDLPDQIDFSAFFRLQAMTYWNFIISGIQQSAVAFPP
jgi:hypothetical protein